MSIIDFMRTFLRLVRYSRNTDQIVADVLSGYRMHRATVDFVGKMQVNIYRSMTALTAFPIADSTLYFQAIGPS